MKRKSHEKREQEKMNAKKKNRYVNSNLSRCLLGEGQWLFRNS